MMGFAVEVLKMAVNWSSSWTCKHKMQYFKYWIFWMEVVNRHTASCWLGSALCELFRSVCVFMWQMFCSSWSVALHLLIWDMSSAACPRKKKGWGLKLKFSLLFLSCNNSKQVINSSFKKKSYYCYCIKNSVLSVLSQHTHIFPITLSRKHHMCPKWVYMCQWTLHLPELCV